MILSFIPPDPILYLQHVVLYQYSTSAKSCLTLQVDLWLYSSPVLCRSTSLNTQHSTTIQIGHQRQNSIECATFSTGIEKIMQEKTHTKRSEMLSPSNST